jgi:hypothetical protein
MMTSRSHVHKLVGLLEDSICAREMVLVSILAAGQAGDRASRYRQSVWNFTGDHAGLGDGIAEGRSH